MSAAGNLWPSLEPGKLRHYIQIQSQSSSQDSFGQQIQSWSTICNVWALIQALSLRDTLQGGVLTSQVTHTITMRWPGSVSLEAGMRVVYNTHTYKIQAINNVEERNIVLRMLVMELNGVE